MVYMVDMLDGAVRNNNCPRGTNECLFVAKRPKVDEERKETITPRFSRDEIEC